MPLKKPARAAAPKVIQTPKVTLTSRQKTEAQKKRKKSKKSTIARYAARAEKREAWAKANPVMEPGQLGQPSRPKVAFPVVETQAQADVVMASGSRVGIAQEPATAAGEAAPDVPVGVDEKKAEEAQEIAQEQRAARAEAGAD